MKKILVAAALTAVFCTGAAAQADKSALNRADRAAYDQQFGPTATAEREKLTPKRAEATTLEKTLDMMWSKGFLIGLLLAVPGIVVILARRK